MRYDSRYHLHLGYYENSHDLEAVALKQENEAVWDVFFNCNDEQSDEFGTRIFSITQDDLDYGTGSSLFARWLAKHGYI